MINTEQEFGEACRECKLIFFLSFGLLLALFILNYAMRGKDPILTNLNAREVTTSIPVTPSVESSFTD